MAKFRVHLYREMRLVYDVIEANSPEKAAQKVRDLESAHADAWFDCDGATLGALVDYNDQAGSIRSSYFPFAQITLLEE